MKNLSTVVEDIYETLSCLSDSRDLEIPDELLEDFGERMKEVLRNWSKPYKAKTSLRMSIIGRPLRRLWYDLKKGHLSKAHMPSSTLIKFLYGHMCEEVLLLFVKMSGHKVEAEQKEVVVGTDEGGFLAMNKESGELALYQPGPLVKINVREKIRRIREAEKLDYPPSRCYNPIPEGKSGNMRLPRQCVYCPHKIDCHSDANNRKGLRVFRYSSGLKYLTRVIVEPKVLEVIAYER